MAPRAGEVYTYFYEEQDKVRPVLVASREEVNRGDVLLIVPFTTQKVEERRLRPSCVFFAAGEAGLDKDCVARADDAYQGAISNLRDRIGVVDDEKMGEVIAAIGYVIDADCYPC